MAQLRVHLFGHHVGIVFICLWMLNSVSGRMVDMTHNLNNMSMHFQFSRDFELKTEVKGYHKELAGAWVEANDMLLSEHTGTHMDAPAHFSKGGKYMHEIPMENLMGPAVVIDIKEQAKTNKDYGLTVDDILEFEKKHGKIPDGAIVFIDTDGAKDYWNYPAYTGGPKHQRETIHFPGFGGESVTWLMDQRNIKGVGIDRMSFDVGADVLNPAHKALLGRGKIGIENANNINKLPPVGATVFVLALPMEGGTGSPARVVAFWDTDLPIYSASDLPSVWRFLMGLPAMIAIFYLNFI